MPDNLPSRRPNHPPGSIDLVEALAWAVGAFAGWLAQLARPAEVRHAMAAERWRSQWRNWVRRAAQAEAGQADFPDLPSLDTMRSSLIGQSRGRVVAILGPPPATSSQPNPSARAAYWHAQVWYYPLDVRRRHALAITFARDTVQAIERLEGPR